MKKAFTLLVLALIYIGANAQAPAIQWAECLGGTSEDGSWCIQQTTDGGYIVAGYSSSIDGDVLGNHGQNDYWIVKLDTAGNIQWQKSLGGTGTEKSVSIQQTTDGGYIIAGSTDSNDGDVSGNHGYGDWWMVKLTAIGSIQWQKPLGGTGHDGALSVQQTTDDGYIVAGWSFSYDGDVSGNHGGGDYWVVKLDTAGSILWQKSLGDSGTDEAISIQQTTDGGYIVAGISNSTSGNVSGNHGNWDYWVVKLDTAGSIQWQKSLGGSGEDQPRSIQQTIDGGYIVAGYSNSSDGDVSGNHGGWDFWVVKLDTAGNILWQKSLGGTGDEKSWFIEQTTDGGYIVAGGTQSNDGDVLANHGGGDSWIVKLDNGGIIQWQKSLGGAGGEGFNFIQQTTDGGFIIAAGSNLADGDVIGFHGLVDWWIVKLYPDNSTAVSITGMDDANGMSLTPNPASTQLSITTNQSSIQSIHICNILGEEALTPLLWRGAGSEANLNISQLPNGIYFIKLTTNNNQVITQKFIKQ